MIEHSRDLIFLVGRDGTIYFANKASNTLLRYRVEDLIGRPISEIISPAEPYIVFPIEPGSLLETHCKKDLFINFMDSTGEYIPLKVNWENFLDNPDINRFILRAYEADAHLKVGEEEKYDEALFAAAFRVNTAMCSITDPATGELLDVNETWMNVMGYTREEVIGKTSLELNIWANPEGRKEALKIIQTQGHLKDFEQEVYIKDGSIKTVLACAEAVKIGSVERLFFSILDITKQKKMEEEQKYRRDLFAASFRVNNALCSISNPDDGEILDVNEIWLDSLGYTRSEVIGKKITELNIWEHPARRKAAVNSLRHIGRFNDHEEIIRTKSGDLRTVIHSAEILKIGSLEHLFSSARDVTDERAKAKKLQESEDRLRQAQKMEAVGQLTGGIAHDFNNLLSIIIGNAEMIEEAGGFDKQVDAILRASTRGSELTQSLLAFSRKQILEPVDFNLETQLKPMLTLLPRTLGATITIRTETYTDLWSCFADPGQVENVLLNLAINARDAMPDGGYLDIFYSNKTLEGRDFASLKVCDTGCGMNEETLEHVLEPFYTTKKVGEGSGLGLSMVSGFAKQSDGHLFLTSAPGKGTTVELCLPRANWSVFNVLP